MKKRYSKIQNPACRGQAGRRRLDGGETFIFCAAENANESLLLRQKKDLVARQGLFSTKCAFQRVKFASQVKLSYGQ